MFKKNCRFSTEFEIISSEVPLGRVKKSKIRVRTNYDLSDRDGWQATGIARFFSFGMFCNWAKQIDIYDTSGEHIGYIDGRLLTTSAACYSLYDRNDQCFGHAYVDRGGRGVVIQDPEMESRILVYLTRIFERDIEDSWEIAVYEPGSIDFRIIRIFSAFMLDLQASFKEDK